MKPAKHIASMKEAASEPTVVFPPGTFSDVTTPFEKNTYAHVWIGRACLSTMPDGSGELSLLEAFGVKPAVSHPDSQPATATETEQVNKRSKRARNR